MFHIRNTWNSAVSSDPKILQTGSEDHDQTANAKSDHLPSLSPCALGPIFASHFLMLSGLVISGFPLKYIQRYTRIQYNCNRTAKT